MTQIHIPLEVLKIESPCLADWNTMVGDERKRFCQGCQKHVHNLSAMPRDEAERLVCESAGNLCVQMALDAEGKFVTVGYQGSTRKRPRRGWRFWTGVGLVGAFLTGVVQAMTGKSPIPPTPTALVPPAPPSTQVTYLRGAICPPISLVNSSTTQPVTMGRLAPVKYLPRPTIATQPSQ